MARRQGGAAGFPLYALPNMIEMIAPGRCRGGMDPRVQGIAKGIAYSILVYRS